MALHNFRLAVAENVSDQTLREVAEILNKSAEKIEDMTTKIKRGR